MEGKEGEGKLEQGRRLAAGHGRPSLKTWCGETLKSVSQVLPNFQETVPNPTLLSSYIIPVISLF